MTVLPVSNIINVTITTTPSGLSEKNVNSLALFTNEVPSNVDVYRTYVSAAQVASDYGTASKTALMANAVFAQSPNILTGKGRLVIIPMPTAVSATQGKFVTANLSANLATLKAVDEGRVRFTVDGVNQDLTDLDFTNASDFDDIAKILQGALSNVIVTVSGSVLTFTCKSVGDDSDIAMAVLSGSGDNLADAGLLNAAGGTATSGADSSGETILEAIARTSGAVGYVPVITNIELEDDAIIAVSNGIQAQDRMFLHHVSTTAAIAGLATDIKDAGNTKTRILLYTDSPEKANLMKAAYAGRGFSVNFTGSFTSQTMQLKQLATITPDDGINQTIYGQCLIAGCDIYVSIDGVPSVISTGGNDFFDNPYSDLALKFALETSGFNYLRQTNTKVPQTEKGMNGLKTAYANVCERFVRNGVIAAGSWTSSETFGDPEIFRENILNAGYYIYSLPVVDQVAAEREERKAPLVQIAVKRAGAIHTGDVIVLVND